MGEHRYYTVKTTYASDRCGDGASGGAVGGNLPCIWDFIDAYSRIHPVGRPCCTKWVSPPWESLHLKCIFLSVYAVELIKYAIGMRDTGLYPGVIQVVYASSALQREIVNMSEICRSIYFLKTIRRKNTRYCGGSHFVSFLWLQFDPKHEILAR